MKQPPQKIKMDLTFFSLKMAKSQGTMKTMKTLGGSPGPVDMEGDSLSKGCGFKSWRWILDGHFSHCVVTKIVKFVWKD